MSLDLFREINEEAAAQRKPAYDIHPMFINRWSPRAFSGRSVSDKQLAAVFEAAGYAPSAANMQPWRYIIATNEAEKQTFKQFINDSNWEWCQHAPVLAVLASKKFRDKEKMNRSYAFDAGASWAYLAMEAMHQGLVAHAMGGFNPDKAKEVLQIPDEYECCVVIAIGYRGDAEQLAEKDRVREKPSARHAVDTYCFKGRFGEEITWSKSF